MSCCNNPKILAIPKEGTEVCTKCGTVQAFSTVDESSELFTFSENVESTNRLGPMIDPTDKMETLETVVSGGGIFNTLNAPIQSSESQQKLRLTQCYEDLASMVRVTQAPETLLQPAKKILRDAYLQKMTYGRTRSALLLSCLAIAAKISHIKFSVSNGATLYDIDTSTVKRSVYKIQAKLFNLSGLPLMRNRVKLVCVQLSLSDKVKRVCLEACGIEKEWARGQEDTMVGALIYLVTRYSHTFEHVKICNISTVLKVPGADVKGLYKKLVPLRYKVLGPMIPQEILRFKRLI